MNKVEFKNTEITPSNNDECLVYCSWILSHNNRLLKNIRIKWIINDWVNVLEKFTIKSNSEWLFSISRNLPIAPLSSHLEITITEIENETCKFRQNIWNLLKDQWIIQEKKEDPFKIRN